MKSAELKEILEIFILKLDENSAELKNSNQILELIDKKVIEIKSFQPKMKGIVYSPVCYSLPGVGYARPMQD